MKGFIAAFATFFITLWFVCLFAGGWIWPYIIGTWSTWAGTPIDVNFIVGVVLGLLPITSQLTFPAWIITWLIF